MDDNAASVVAVGFQAALDGSLKFLHGRQSNDACGLGSLAGNVKKFHGSKAMALLKQPLQICLPTRSQRRDNTSTGYDDGLGLIAVLRKNLGRTGHNVLESRTLTR